MMMTTNNPAPWQNLGAGFSGGRGVGFVAYPTGDWADDWGYQDGIVLAPPPPVLPPLDVTTVPGPSPSTVAGNPLPPPPAVVVSTIGVQPGGVTPSNLSALPWSTVLYFGVGVFMLLLLTKAARG